MAGAKVVVLYPQPKDVAAFEKVYLEEHMPLAAEKLLGVSKVVLSKTFSPPTAAPPPFHRITEIHFPTLEALQSCLSSLGGKETAAHAILISTGGPPVFMIAEEETLSSAQRAKA